MMPEQKGRSGKKPKYQIPDIGGADLTAEDISTERVLNFLIKGESASSEETDAAQSPEAVDAEKGASVISDAASQTVQDKGSSTPLPSSETSSKRGLAHLFERAGSGGNVAKDLPLRLPADEQVEDSTLPRERSVSVQQTEDSALRESSEPPVSEHAPPSVEETSEAVLASKTSVASESPIQEEKTPLPIPSTVAETSPGLARYIELWKNFYRLNAGEVDVMCVMYRLSHDQGRAECYIKMHSLAEMSNLTYRYCQKVVRSLEQLGWITKLKDYDPTNQMGILYRVNLKPSILS
ncbi:MAG TPA: hypothetical protein VFQ47_05110 [Nitrososphaera sp.]|jgi:hypothetical protein|nr:hypothetical protein [Nitrososphaera sp.]